MDEQKFCYKYPHPAVTADCVIFGFDGVSIKVLLIERGIEPFKGKWAFPGGFMNDVIKNIAVTPQTNISAICESCGEEAVVRLRFPDGVGALFNVVNRRKKFGTK